MLTLPARIIRLYRDPEYYRQLFKVAIPIALQSLVMSLLNMTSVLMIGQKGDVAVAAVGLAGQVFFLFNLILFGIGSGSAMFTAQLWGKGDLASLRKVLGLCLTLCLGAAVFYVLLGAAWPETVLKIYSRDPQVIVQGGAYLRLFAWSFPFFAVSFSYSMVLRSTGEVRWPLVISASSLGLGTALTYGLIFGKFGLPEMGIQGAALATVLARALECVSMAAMAYLRQTAAAASLRQLLGFNRQFVAKVLKPVLPVMANETLWSLGIAAYNVVYARIGTDSIAAMNIVATIDNLGMVFFFGVTSATGILVGNRIGAGEEQEAMRYAARSLGLGASLALLVGMLELALRTPILSLYRISPAAVQNAYNVLTIVGLFLSIRVMNMLLIVGILRSGGDTVYAMVLDGVIIWVLGVPMAVLGGLALGLPVYWVYLMVMSEELVKCTLGLRRFFTRKWMHDLARTV